MDTELDLLPLSEPVGETETLTAETTTVDDLMPSLDGDEDDDSDDDLEESDDDEDNDDLDD